MEDQLGSAVVERQGPATDPARAAALPEPIRGQITLARVAKALDVTIGSPQLRLGLHRLAEEAHALAPGHETIRLAAVALNALKARVFGGEEFEVAQAEVATARSGASRALTALLQSHPPFLEGDAQRAWRVRRILVYLRAILRNQPVLAAVAAGLLQLTRREHAYRQTADVLAGPAPAMTALMAYGGNWQKPLVKAFHTVVVRPPELRVAPEVIAAPAGRRPAKYRPFARLKPLVVRGLRIRRSDALIHAASTLPDPQWPAIASRLAADLREEKTAAYACAVYFTNRLQIAPRNFDCVLLGPWRAGGESWLDLAAGHLSLSLANLTGTRGRWPPALAHRAVFFIPIAAEVISDLRRRLQGNPAAQNLAQLLGIDREFMTDFEAYVHSLAISSWSVTIERLLSSFAEYVAAKLGDEVAVDAALAYGGLAPLSAYHYCTVRPDRLHWAAAEIDRLLGLSGSINEIVGGEECSLHPPPADEALAECLRTCVEQAARAGKLPPHVGETDLLKRVEVVALNTLAVLAISTGLRGTRTEEIVLSNFLPDLSAFVVADKFEDRLRYVPIPPSVAAILRLYLHVLESVTRGLEKSGSHFAGVLGAISAWDSTRPLFVKRNGKALAPLLAADLTAHLRQWGLERNDGRRLVSAVLDRAGRGSAVESAVNGREDGTLAGPYGASSLVVPQRLVDSARIDLETELVRLGFPASRITPKAPRDPPMTRAAPTTLPVLPRNHARPRAYRTAEKCPIRPGDGFRIGAYLHALKTFRGKPPADPVVVLALALVFTSGVINRDELLAVIAALIQREAHHDKGKVFVQTTTDALGLREVVLTGLPVLLIDRLPRVQPTDLPGRIDAAVAELLTDGGGGDLNRLLDYAAATAVFVLPGPVREFVIGRLVGRTLDLAARARRTHYDDVAVVPRPWTLLPSHSTARVASRRTTPFRTEIAPIVRALEDANTAKGDDAKRDQTKKNLEQIHDLSLSEHAVLFLRILRRVADDGDKPGTLIRYAAPLRSLLEAHRETAGKVAEDDNVQKWIDIFRHDEAEHLRTSDSNRRIRRTVRKCLAEELGIPLDGGDSARMLPKVPVDFMDDADLSRAIAYVNALQEQPLQIRELTIAYLDFRSGSGVRSDEAAHFRVEDFCDDLARLCGAVNYRSGTTTKTRGAYRTRLLCLRHPDLIRRLLRLTHAGPLFPPKDIDMAEEIASIAQRRATGNPKLDTMALRRIGMNRDYSAAMQPGASVQVAAHELLNRLPRLSRSFGHYDTSTTFGCYYALLSDDRHSWCAQLDPGFRLKISMRLTGVACAVRDEAARKRMKRQSMWARSPDLPPLLDSAPRLEPWATCVDGAGESERVHYAACRLAGLSDHDAETSVSIHPVSANLIEDALKQLAWSPGREQKPPRPSADALDAARHLMEALVQRLDPMLVQDALRTIKVAVGGLELTTDRPAAATARAIVDAISTSQLVPRAVFTRPRGGTRKHRTGAIEIVRALSDPALKHDRVLLYATCSGRRNAIQALLLSAALVAGLSGFITPSNEVA